MTLKMEGASNSHDFKNGREKNNKMCRFVRSHGRNDVVYCLELIMVHYTSLFIQSESVEAHFYS